MRDKFLTSLVCLGLMSGTVFASDCLYDDCNMSDAELVEMYNDTMESAAETAERIEDFLQPQRLKSNLWLDGKDANVAIVEDNFDFSKFATGAEGLKADGCPFETARECEIWRKKPIVRETVAPRSSKIRVDKFDEILDEISCAGELDAGSYVAAPLVERYKILMRSARACCTEGVKHSLQSSGASDGLIYKFLVDDANFYNIGDRCMVMTDDQIDELDLKEKTKNMVSDVRNRCLCRGRAWLTSLLAPFVTLWNESPEFATSKFYWTYRDGLNRDVTVSINDDVQNVLDQLESCPQ